MTQDGQPIETTAAANANTTSLFSAPEPALRHAKQTSRPPATNPFQAPDFGELAEADEEPA
ncbi:hypothetical protein [Streptomyces sp. NBC_01262]|uniref:hypothetical protein n=1 Tax=Streptomyces sp. NBC_01262 TaxID=2903803 RepID=UPI002E35BA7A|nr:hypothetical protein [Streptomyces sp. NBC_01262]